MFGSRAGTNTRPPTDPTEADDGSSFGPASSFLLPASFDQRAYLHIELLIVLMSQKFQKADARIL